VDDSESKRWEIRLADACCSLVSALTHEVLAIMEDNSTTKIADGLEVLRKTAIE
jgi:hypothetical protein